MVTRKQREEKTEEENIKEDGKIILEDLILACSGKPTILIKEDLSVITYIKGRKKENLCDCVTESLNYMIPDLPKGEKTKTRRIFKMAIELFNKKKEKKEITGCTESLISI